jgi:hypothetical protein
MGLNRRCTAKFLELHSLSFTKRVVESFELENAGSVLRSSEALFGPRRWGITGMCPEDFPKLRFSPIRFSEHLSIKMLFDGKNDGGSSVSAPLSTSDQISELALTSERLCVTDATELFNEVVGPRYPAEMWIEILNLGEQVFKRKTDHRVMIFRSLVSQRDERIVTESLEKFLSADSFTFDDIMNDKIGQHLAGCDLIVLEPDNKTCHIASPYARIKLVELLGSLTPRRGLADRIRSFFSF